MIGGGGDGGGAGEGSREVASGVMPASISQKGEKRKLRNIMAAKVFFFLFSRRKRVRNKEREAPIM